MATYNEGPYVTRTAGAVINPRRFVKMSAPKTVIQSAAATDIGAGVAGEGAASGLACKVQIIGTAKVEVGTGGVTAGTRVTSDSVGRAVAWATTNQSYGVAEETRAAGEIAEIHISAPTHATVV